MNEVLKALYDACMETQAITKTKMDIKQYKADLQCAYDCGYNAGKSDKVEQEPFINKPCVSEGACQQHTEDVLGKISAEIEQLREEYKVHWEMEEANALDKTLSIIDKYKAESEGKNETDRQ